MAGVVLNPDLSDSKSRFLLCCIRKFVFYQRKGATVIIFQNGIYICFEVEPQTLAMLSEPCVIFPVHPSTVPHAVSLCASLAVWQGDPLKVY